MSAVSFRGRESTSRGIRPALRRVNKISIRHSLRCCIAGLARGADCDVAFAARRRAASHDFHRAISRSPPSSMPRRHRPDSSRPANGISAAGIAALLLLMKPGVIIFSTIYASAHEPLTKRHLCATLFKARRTLISALRQNRSRNAIWPYAPNVERIEALVAKAEIVQQ